MFSLGFNKIANEMVRQPDTPAGSDDGGAADNAKQNGLTNSAPDSFTPAAPSQGKQQPVSKKKMNPQQTAGFFMQKGAGVESSAQTMSSGGSISPGVSQGLKYDQSTPEPTVEKEADIVKYTKKKKFLRGLK